MTRRSKVSDPASERKKINRREFMAGAAAISITVIKAEQVRGSHANSKISLGLIGCGGRGVWIAGLFQKHGGYQLVAGADYFADRVNSFGEKFSVETGRRYTGLAGYKRLLESKVDAIAVESPPYFHPEQAAAGVDAGAHVYLAKPNAVDVPGCRTVEESAKKATAQKRCFLVDFQTRTDPFYVEAVRRVRAGEIGAVICGEATYVAGSPWTSQMAYLREDPKDPERRLRAWGMDRALSGDIITEQNIHALDVATWLLNQAPVRAYGTGGLKSRDLGTCWDHFSVIYTFPGDIVLTFHSKQYGRGIDDICCRLYALEGVVDTHYFGEVNIKGKTPYEGGKVGDLYTNGAIRNIETFHRSITEGDWSNKTVGSSVRSNLTTILGRTAAYRRSEVTWDEMMKSDERLDPHIDGLKS
ncbi:MAG TPA: Gfo/Idh/MocA family oxidoreductase [Acidobacteriota bacterium]|nr:Gfo/Idh/MocA family oxidoreductase [Acidobacteriota bacterium]